MGHLKGQLTCISVHFLQLSLSLFLQDFPGLLHFMLSLLFQHFTSFFFFPFDPELMFLHFFEYFRILLMISRLSILRILHEIRLSLLKFFIVNPILYPFLLLFSDLVLLNLSLQLLLMLHKVRVIVILLDETILGLGLQLLLFFFLPSNLFLFTLEMQFITILHFFVFFELNNISL